MDGMLSQEEINALLGSMDAGEDNQASSDEIDTTPEVLTPEEADALGEVANISMGTAATTLSILVNNRVDITTPSVTYTTLDDLEHEQEEPCVFIYISYREGLEGENILVLNEKDVKIITDLMMGGDGSNIDGELGDLHLSAICEAMNQMMGSAATSMSSMLDKKVDISPPTATKVDFGQDMSEDLQKMRSKTFAKVSFHMEIGDLVDSQIMQLYPLDFAKHIHERFMGVAGASAEKTPTPDSAPAASTAPVEPAVAPAPSPAPAAAPYEMPAASGSMAAMGMMGGMQPGMGAYGTAMPAQPDVNIQPAQFQNLSQVVSVGGVAPENIDLIMDVPLEVTVELGRTSKSIKDILDFSPGTIIELDKLAGEPVDVLVNGKFVAKGEVVVIEESFGIRVTEIIKEQR